jgi:LysR family transcriptional activator of nhaA
MKAFGAAHNAIFVAPTLYAHDFYHDESLSGYLGSVNSDE